MLAQDAFSSTKNDKIGQINEQIDATIDTMVQNLDRILQRGERIDLLVTKTEELQSNAIEFRKTSTTLKRHFWWQNVKMWIIVGICVVVRLLSPLSQPPQFLHCAAGYFP